jgi:hypothetical protein
VRQRTLRKWPIPKMRSSTGELLLLFAASNLFVRIVKYLPVHENSRHLASAYQNWQASNLLIQKLVSGDQYLEVHAQLLRHAACNIV